jgi:hypothetical protein
VRGLQLINAPQCQAASGWIGGETLQLNDLTVAVTTPQAVVCANSLDGKPLAESQRVLLTCQARAVAPGGRLPFRTEPVVGEVSLRAAPGLKVQALSGRGEVLAELPTRVGNGWYSIRLAGTERTHWFLIGP